MFYFIIIYLLLKKLFAGYIQVLGGTHVARGPDVARAWSTLNYSDNLIKNLRKYV
jgi:hypothetical protein